MFPLFAKKKRKNTCVVDVNLLIQIYRLIIVELVVIIINCQTDLYFFMLLTESLSLSSVYMGY